MTFYVEKKLALGPIRFGVSPRNESLSIDSDPGLSTGPAGEFIRHGREGFFFGGVDRFDAPRLPTPSSIRSMPFWTSMKESRGLLILAAVGVVFLLLGFAVVAKKGPAGWVEVILGAAMLGTPIGLTAQRRKQIREKEERERAEREAAEQQKQEMLTAYTVALEQARQRRDEASLDRLQQERERLTLPYELWGSPARRATLLIGFDELAKRGVTAAKDVAQLMDRFSRAAGITPEDETNSKLDLYRTIVWHLLADDRMGAVQEEQLKTLRKGLDIWNRDVPLETTMTEEFRRLGGITGSNLPRGQCTRALAFKEVCFYNAQTEDGTLHVTNKRLLLEAKKEVDVALPAISEVVVNLDEGTVWVRTDDPKKPLRMKVSDPIYTASMIDFASSIDERPKGFA